MATCARVGCRKEGKPTFCSRRCAGITGAASRGHDFWVAAGRRSGAIRRAKATRSPDYLRGYQAGWQASEHWFTTRGRIKRGRHSPVRKDVA